MVFDAPLPDAIRFITIVETSKFESLGIAGSILKFRRKDGESESPLFTSAEKATFFGSIAFGDDDSKFAMYSIDTVAKFIEFFSTLNKQKCRYVIFDPQHGLSDKSLVGRVAEVSEFMSHFPSGDA